MGQGGGGGGGGGGGRQGRRKEGVGLGGPALGLMLKSLHCGPKGGGGAARPLPPWPCPLCLSSRLCRPTVCMSPLDFDTVSSGL